MKKSSLTTARKGKSRGSLKGQTAAAGESDVVTEMQLEDIHELVWRALPTVQTEVREYMEHHGAAAGEAGEVPDEEVTAPIGTFDGVQVPWSDMQQLVTSLFRACHTNPIQDDIDSAVAGVVGTAAEPVQAAYTKSDVSAFFDTAPSLWMTLQDSDATSDRQHRQYCEELAKAVTDDEAPFPLVEPARVMTVVHATTLATPLDHFVTLSTPAPCAPVFRTVWSNLVEGCNATTTTAITLSQFRVFFVWFYALHFDNTTPTRSEAVAEYVYRRFRGGHPAGMTMPHFEDVCRYLVECYAQRRDTEHYLGQLVQATQETLRARQIDINGAVFFSVGDEVTSGIAPRKTLMDPQTLFMPDELGEWQFDATLYQTPLSSNRICVYGKRGSGKTSAGKALADRLNCAHLDVLALAEACLAANDLTDPLTQQLLNAMQTNTAISLDVQVALLTRELEVRGLYHGYVWSETFPVTEATADTVASLLQAVGITSRVLPNIFVHLTVDESIYEERRAEQLATQLAAREAALNDPVAVREAQMRTLADARKECELALKRLVELEARDGAADSSAEDVADLEAARTQVADAQNRLEELEAQLAATVEAAGDEGSDDEDGLQARGASVDDADEEAQSNRAAARVAAQRTAKLAMLIRDGRQRLYENLEHRDGTPAGAVEQELPTIPALGKAADSATTLAQHLTVDGLSDSADLVAYVVDTLRLQRCAVATIPSLEEDGADASNFPATVAGDEQLGRALEDAATSASCAPSAVWKHFCPVTYKEDQVLVEGASCYLCVYRGEVYYCASKRKRERFMGNPFLYLRESPATYQRTLVLASDRLLSCLAQTSLNLDAMADQLANTLRLTRLGLKEYARAVQQRRDLKQARKEALTQRRQELAEERHARDERQEKRMKLEAKKKKKDKRKSDPRQATVRFAKDVPAGNAGGVPRRKVLIQDAVQERIEDVLAKTIADEKLKSRESVPVLLSLVDAGDFDKTALDLLYAERMVPERVLVLDHIAATADELGDEEEDAQEADVEADEEGSEGGPSADKPTSSTGEVNTATRVAAFVEQLERGAPTGWKADDSGLPAQSFTVERVNVADKDELELLLELKQLLCPGAVACKDGVPDEELGNPDDREADPDEEEEAALADEEDPNFPALPPKPPQHAQALPGRRFLNQFGSRLNYCPVTLHEERLLVHGKNEYCTDYRGKLYVFASEACLNRFQTNPLKYVDQPAPRDIPPRVWVVGTTNSGRHTLARDLQKGFQIPFFTYDRKFFEACIEAARKPGGAEVSGIRIPYDASGNPYVLRAEKLLKKIRDLAEAEEKGLKLRAEATAKLEEQARRAEAAAEMSDPDEESFELDEEEEENLRLAAEFEPEDEEEKQTRLTESYLRIASCVTRFEPFESKGYIMVCPPFSELDQDVLFSAGGIPEVVVYLRQSADTFRERAEVQNATLRAAREEYERAARDDPVVQEKAAARERRRRERALRKWRRRHIGVDDPPSDQDDQEAGNDENDADADAAAQDAGAAFDEMDVDGTLSLETDAIEEFISAVKDRQVDVVAIDADRPLETVRRLSREKLRNRLEDRLSFLCACEVVTYETARKRLEEGRTNLSVFGTQDPVAVFEARCGKRRACVRKPDGFRLAEEGTYIDDADDSGSRKSLFGAASADRLPSTTGEEGRHSEQDADGAQNSGGDGDDDEAEPDELSEYGSEELTELRDRQDRRDRILAKRAAPRCCQLGCRVFFFETEHTMLEFMQNPLFYVEQPPPLPPMRTKPVLAVFEEEQVAARSNALKLRSAAEHVAFNLHAEFINVPKLLSWASLHPRLGSLRARALESAMRRAVDDDLISRLLTLRLADARVKHSGAVLLNLPRSTAECDALMAASVSPIAKVATLVSLDSAESSSSSGSAHSAQRAGVGHLASQMLHGLQSDCGGPITLAVPHAANSSDLTNVVEMVHRMDDLERASRDLLLRTQSGFPADLRHAYYSQSFKEKSMSEYRTYCPYCWTEEGDLVECGASPYRASYLGRMYFFHSTLHLHAFMSRPTTVADPDTLQPLPPTLPERLVLSEAEQVALDRDTELEYQGCCPVVLYDTREHRGLRGELEPVAEPGSLDCVVRYGDKLFALRNEECLARFMRRPWEYVEGAAMPPPRKRPLTPNRRRNGVDDEEFLRRQLYDAVAYALVAVGTERPCYPGLSAEESALKFVALHMKAHNAAENNSIQNEQYQAQFELFRKRAKLYARSEASALLSEEGCAEYERVRYGFHKLTEFATLKKAA